MVAELNGQCGSGSHAQGAWVMMASGTPPGCRPFRGINVAVLPVQQWHVQSEAGDKVSLSEKDGCLRIDYDVDIQKLRQSGHESFKEKSFRVLLKEARPLAAGEDRVVFEAQGMESDFAAACRRCQAPLGHHRRA